MEQSMNLGEQLKESGQASVLAHQEPTWQERVENYITVHEWWFDITLDTIRACWEERGYPQPTHPNAWGAVMSSLSKKGKLICVGYRPSTRPSRHAGIVRVWRRA